MAIQQIQGQSDSHMSKKSNQTQIRFMLRLWPDGMTALDLSKQIGVGANSISVSLKAMPDAYIDRWIKKNRGPYAAVWCVVDVPENCPKPTDTD